MYGCYVRVLCGMYAIFCMFNICYLNTLSYTMCLSCTYTRIYRYPAGYPDRPDEAEVPLTERHYIRAIDIE